MLPRGKASQANQQAKTGNGPFQVGGSEVPTVLTQAGSTTAVSVPPVQTTNATISVTTSSGTALAANSSAKFRQFTNLATTTIPSNVFLAFGTTAVAGSQVCLRPNGPSFVMLLSSGNMDTRQVNCITDTGTATLLVTEGS